MSTGSGTQTELQKTFITMLFAFAVSVVAQQIAELLIVSTSNWTSPLMPGEIYTKLSQHALPLAAAGTHSLLALLMLSVSWIMWSKSQAAGHRADITEVFSIKFITFLMEVVLVTLYFSLSKSVEGDFSNYSKDKNIASYITPASAKPEAMQMFWIFFIFAVWDLIVDVWKSPTNPTQNTGLKGPLNFLAGFITYCSVSMICATGAWFVYIVTPVNGQPLQAIYGDISLVALLLLFNQGKILEHYIFKLLPLQETRQNTKRLPSPKRNALICILLLIYFACMAANAFYPCIHK